MNKGSSFFTHKYLFPTDLRAKIYRSRYWAENCVDSNMMSLMDKVEELEYISDHMSPFMCLLLNMLQMQPDEDIVIEMIRKGSNKYLSALCALYLRITSSNCAKIYLNLEPLYEDHRELVLETEEGTFTSKPVDEFIKGLLGGRYFLNIELPSTVKWKAYGPHGVLGRRDTALQDDFEEKEEKAEDCQPTDNMMVRITIGIKLEDGVILATEKTDNVVLSDPDIPGNFMFFDEHVVCALSYSTVNARKLLWRAQIETLNHRFLYAPMTVDSIVQDFRYIVRVLNEQSESFDTSFLIGGHDEQGPSLYYIDPSGVRLARTTKAIGIFSEVADKLLEERYFECMTLTQAENLAVSVLSKYMIPKVSPDNIAIAKVSPTYHLYSTSEIEQVLRRDI